MIRQIAASVLMLSFLAGLAQARDVVFIGLTGEGAPAVEKTFDRLIREHLSVMPDVNAVDYVETQRYKEKINFESFPTVSRALVESLDRFAIDTTVFVWGTVRKCSVRPVRRYLVGAAIRGDLVINLTMYSLSQRQYAYAGDITVSEIKSKGYILFGSVEKYVHITALDRTDIIEKMENEAVTTAGRMLQAVIRSEKDKNGEVGADVEKYKVPSLADVFSVPSMEAKAVGGAMQDSGKDSTKSKQSAAQPDSSKAGSKTAAKK